MLPALLSQSHSTDREQLLHTTTARSIVGLDAPLIAHIMHGSSGPLWQALAVYIIQPACRLPDQRIQGRGLTGVAARPYQEAEEEEVEEPTLQSH